MVGDELARPHVDDAVGDGVPFRLFVPLHAVEIERIALYVHFRARDVQRVLHHHLLRVLVLAVEHVEARGDGVVVTARSHPELAVAVLADTVQVDAHRNLLDLFHAVDFHHRHGAVVIRRAVASRVGHVKVFPEHLQLVRLVTHRRLARDGKRSRVHFIYGPQLGVRVDGHGTHVGRDVGFPLGKADVAAVGNVHLPDALAGTYVHHLHLVRAVDDGIQLVAVYLDVVAHVAQFLDHLRVAFGVDVAHVVRVAEVHVVDGRLVAAHVGLVEQVHAGRSCVRGYGHAR